MSYRRTSYRRPSTPRSTGPRTNKYPAPCQGCGQDVPAGQGELFRDGATWRVRHLAARWHGSPVSGRYVGGCPGEADRHNLAGQWGRFAEPRCADSTHAEQVTATGGCDSCNREIASQLPAPAASCETELVWCENTHHPVGVHRLTNECEDPHGSGRYAPVQAEPGADLREVSRRAGSKYAYTSSGARMTMSSRRCEDAPCCGCCD